MKFPKIGMNLSCDGEMEIVNTSVGYYAWDDPISTEKHLEMTIEAKSTHKSINYTLYPDRIGLLKVLTMKP